MQIPEDMAPPNAVADHRLNLKSDLDTLESGQLGQCDAPRCSKHQLPNSGGADPLRWSHQVGVAERARAFELHLQDLAKGPKKDPRAEATLQLPFA